MTDEVTQDEIAVDEAEVVTDVAESEVEEQSQDNEPSESSTEKEKGNQAQKRIDELTRKRREAERERDYWREQAAKQPEPPKEAPKLEVKTLEDFDYDEAAYQRHLFDQARNGAIEEAKRVLREEQEQAAKSRRTTEFKSKVDEFAKNVEDFADVVYSPDLAINQVMVEVASEMDDGPAVLYYLGKNPDIAEQISRLSPLSAAREMGRIEAKIASQAKAGEKVSKAPAPAPKIGAIEASFKVSPTSPESDKMSIEEWTKARNKQLSRKQ